MAQTDLTNPMAIMVYQKKKVSQIILFLWYVLGLIQDHID